MAKDRPLTSNNIPHESAACAEQRVVIEALQPQIDNGRFHIKRVVGERVCVEADLLVDGHDRLAACLLHRREDDSTWQETAMQLQNNNRWAGEFTVTEIGKYRYSVCAWVDAFESWRHDLRKRLDAEQDIAVPLLVGHDLIAQAKERATAEAAPALLHWLQRLRASTNQAKQGELALSAELASLMAGTPDRRYATWYMPELTVTVDRVRARYSAWYELFPRSCAVEAGRHGTLRDCEQRLPYIAAMGFDVVYLPPIHPIGKLHRKGKNNTAKAEPGDVGSPWAIGAAVGGHKALHPELGGLEDLHKLITVAKRLGMEIALDIAFQCAPDHPYVQEHPSWFRRRPDGSVQYAENPPKKYQDIYPFDFETADRQALWDELAGVVRHWAGQGVRIFRVDNPHTKPFRFWEWLIADIKTDYPDAIFLAEAFTVPKVMHHLAKLGFSQSYTYFTWRNDKEELEDYFTELSQGPGRDYFRPNLWPNTPDILHEFLHFQGLPAFAIRFVLAATLGASYGIYGPAFELGENQPREPGSEEYLHSEKYELKHWDFERAGLQDLITRVNTIRREHPALHSDGNLRFHTVDNDHLIAYSKHIDDFSDVIIVVVNLDAHAVQTGWLQLAHAAIGLAAEDSYRVHDLLSGERYTWQGTRIYIKLDPEHFPAHILVVER